MKRNISLINIDRKLLQWLTDRLQQESPDSPAADDLLAACRDLSAGQSDSLMLALDAGDNGEGSRPEEVIECDDLRIEPRTRRVLRGAEEISLTPKEFDILWFLARNRGEVFTKEQIYRAVWADDYLMDDSNIMAFIRKLRRKIEPNPDAPRYILTIWGIGYKFNDAL